MRSRNIKPSFFKNEKLADLGMSCRILFIGLWCLADRNGILEDRPRRIKAEIFPYDEIEIEKLLNLLMEHKFIIRYYYGAEKYIQVVNFTKHQKIHHTERESTYPAPFDNGDTTVICGLSNGDKPPEVLNTEVLNTESAPKVKKVISQNGFDSFWQMYPRKKAKGAAEVAWKKIKRLPEFNLERILSAIEKQRGSPGWQKNNGQFIPYPSTWLNQKRWEDDAGESQDQEVYLSSLETT